MSGGPLSGIRIVDMTSVVVGPMVTQVLADYGADVVKIEPPGGDLVRGLAGRGRTEAMSSKFLHLNRNKRSIALDLKKPAAQQVLTRLIEKGDVLIWNMRPVAMDKLGLSYEAVRKINPGIIYCGIVGFGSKGRYAGKPAYDPIIQGLGGIAALHHRATGEPRYVPIVMADKNAGLVATQMLLIALLHRQRTGEGQSIEVPMFENIAKYVLEEHLYLSTFQPPLGEMGDPRIFDPWAKPIPTSDGWICMAANTDQQAFAFFAAIGKPRLKDDPRFCNVKARFQNVRDYFALRSEALAKKTTAEWIKIFDDADIPAMPYNTLESLARDPHLKDVGLLRTVMHPTEGEIYDIKPPNSLSCGAREDYLPAPKVGQHSLEVLRELGYGEEEIAEMVRSHVAIDGKL
ncbi:MAG TPA: CaiB/BaiF CoA-transferase family protein [Burkholderiales bacterium]|nr:CaiB/BaiF CoA-transferase family protein [Burkholderiales bacterium]